MAEDTDVVLREALEMIEDMGEELSLSSWSSEAAEDEASAGAGGDREGEEVASEFSRGLGGRPAPQLVSSGSENEGGEGEEDGVSASARRAAIARRPPAKRQKRSHGAASLQEALVALDADLDSSGDEVEETEDEGGDEAFGGRSRTHFATTGAREPSPPAKGKRGGPLTPPPWGPISSRSR